jgi:signal peptidase I
MITFKKREIIYRPHEVVIKTIVDVIVIICLAFLMVTFFFDNTTITGHSMNATLNHSDVMLVNKAVYKFRNPDRYDIIIFKPNIGNVSDNYIKRVIGLPGETVQIIDGKVHIDGKVLSDDVIDMEIYNAGNAAEPITLGYNEYFVLGDNRNNSDDSRFSNVGLVKSDSIIGVPWFVIYPFEDFGGINTSTLETEVSE